MSLNEKSKAKLLSIKVRYKEDGIYLVINNPNPDKNISPADVAWVISQNDIPDINKSVIDSLCRKKIGVAEIKVSDAVITNDVDEAVTLKITNDKMQVHAKFTPPKSNGKKVEHTEIMQRLSEMGVTFGIREDIIKRLVANKNYAKTYIIATGKSPVKGVDGRAIFHVDVQTGTYQPKISDTGKADYHNLDLFKCVKKGEILCTTIDPVDGEDGINVLGVEIKHKKASKPPRVIAGKNVKFDQENQSIISDMDGQLIYTSGKLSVFPILEVPGDVGPTTGNVEFNGSVVIKGNVATGFKVIASGNVDIGGVIEGAYVQCGGDLNCSNGIQGMDKARIMVMGSVITKYIRNCNLETGGDITTSTIMHSHVKCTGKVDVTSDKGIIAGGVLEAIKSVDVKIIGSKLSTDTKITVGVFSEIFQRYNSCTLEIREHEEEYNKMANAAEKIQNALAVKPELAAVLQKYESEKLKISEKISELKSEFDYLQTIIKSATGHVNILDVVNPGVVISIGNAALIVKDEIRHCKLYNSEGRIMLGTI